MYKNESLYEWSIGNCISSHKWYVPGTYTEKCCLPKGEHILECTTVRTSNDWSNTPLTMLGHRFCDDHVGHKAMISLNITGIYQIQSILQYYINIKMGDISYATHYNESFILQN